MPRFSTFACTAALLLSVAHAFTFKGGVKTTRSGTFAATPVGRGRPRIIPQGAQEIAKVPPMTYSEVAAAAAFWGCRLELTVLGPSYRVELRQTDWRRADIAGSGGMYVNDATGEERVEIPQELEFVRKTGSTVGETDDVIMVEERNLLGYTVGFVQPGLGESLLHLDTMQVRRFSGYWAKRSDYKGVAPRKMNAPKPGTYGLGLLLGGAAACFGRELGAGRAELLAIYDDARQHQILVRYYKRLGFSEVRDVGDDLSSFGDRLTWGGAGKLMETDLVAWVKKFAPVIRDPMCGLL